MPILQVLRECCTAETHATGWRINVQAAGVALMGQARGSYTFFVHLKWTPVIAAGFSAGALLHVLLSGIGW